MWFGNAQEKNQIHKRVYQSNDVSTKEKANVIAERQKLVASECVWIFRLMKNGNENEMANVLCRKSEMGFFTECMYTKLFFVFMRIESAREFHLHLNPTVPFALWFASHSITCIAKTIIVPVLKHFLFQANAETRNFYASETRTQKLDPVCLRVRHTHTHARNLNTLSQNLFVE